MNYLKVGKATELQGKNRFYYRLLEMLPGFLSWSTLLILIILSYFQPIWVAYFIIAFDIYWLLLVLYLALHLIAAYKKLKHTKLQDWEKLSRELKADSKIVGEEYLVKNKDKAQYLYKEGVSWSDLTHLVVLPTCNESLEIIKTTVSAIYQDSYPSQNMAIVLAIEERAGEKALARARQVAKEFGGAFKKFFISVHPDNIEGELKGKGANQAWAIKDFKKQIIDPQGWDYDKMVVSVFDIDTVITRGYFFRLSYKFLTTPDPYYASYQPVPVYHNNIWQAPFFARIAATSNTFWQMMQQIRSESLATYSSHSMSFKALNDIGFWSTTMVSEDSRIFWHCLLYYKGRYRVEPLHFPVSMDATMDENFLKTAKSLYKQQRRWAWGSENIPYLIFNTFKNWKSLDKKTMLFHIFVQLYGFHSWATNALIIAVIGWMPLWLGGERFTSTVLSGNLPEITTLLMNLAMVGLILSAIISTLLLPSPPFKIKKIKKLQVVVEWIFIPVVIVLFGAIPALEAQTRLLLGKYMGFWVTPKKR
ncbi:MAG: glycosyltransferase family 2 protein [Candidatus Pacebacteria bacterium]|nr:glycosyltransferase family 2 protein [Candidatus Paceibacterota bacterium]